jgi:hypothetical protein
MVSTQEVIDAIIYALESSDVITDDASYIDHDPDITTEAIKLPVIQVSPNIKNRISDENTDFIGLVDGESENSVKEVYEALYTLDVTIAAWTAEGSQYSGREIQESITEALFKYETSGMDEPLKKSDGSVIDDIWRFTVQTGEQNDDLNTTPTLRRWRKTVIVSMSETFESEEQDTITGAAEDVSVN